MCKWSPFDETRFVTSSVAGNHVTVYDSFIRSNTSNVNSSKFQDWNNLVLTSCKRNALEICWESCVLKNPNLNTLEANLAVKVRLELEASELQKVQRFNHSATLPVATVIPWIGIYPVI